MMKKNLRSFVFLFLNDISDKFDANALKGIVDIAFIVTEKIIIHFPSILPLYVEYYSDIIDHEIKLTHMDQTTSVLHVGCGSIPASSMLLAQKCNAKVTGIDRDEKAVKKARICVENNGLSHQIDIQQKDALQMDLLSYNVILISQGIIPKESFLKELSKHISSDQILILRSFSRDGAIDDADKFLNQYYAIVQIYHHTNHGETVSIILQKK